MESKIRRKEVQVLVLVFFTFFFTRVLGFSLVLEHRGIMGGLRVKVERERVLVWNLRTLRVAHWVNVSGTGSSRLSRINGH